MLYLNKKWGLVSFWIPILFFGCFLYLPLILFLGEYFSVSALFSFFTDPLYLKIFSFTFRESFLSAFITVILALPGAYLVGRTYFIGKRLFLSLSLISFIMPGISVALGFVLLFGKRGVLHTIFGLDIPLLYTFWAIIFAHVFYNFSLAVRIIGAHWEGLPLSYEEEAKIQGANSLQVFYLVDLPYLFPSISSAFLITFIYSFMSFAVVLVLGGIRYVTLEVEIYMYLTKLINFQEAAKLVWIQFLTLLILTWLLFLTKSNFSFEYEKDTINLKKFPFWGYIYLSFVFLLIFVPMGAMFIGGFWDFINHRFTLVWFRNIFSGKFSSYVGTLLSLPIINTFKYAFWVSILVFILIIIGSFYVVYRNKYKGILFVVFASSLFISPLTLGFSYVYLRGFIDMPPNIGIVLSHTLIALPIAMQIFFGGRESIPNSIREASFVDGATPIKSLFYIEFPILIPYIISALSLSFAISIGEVGATLLLYDVPNNMTIPVAMVRLLSARRIGEAEAYSTLLFGIALLLFLITDVFLKRASGE